MSTEKFTIGKLCINNKNQLYCYDATFDSDLDKYISYLINRTEHINIIDFHMQFSIILALYFMCVKQ